MIKRLNLIILLVAVAGVAGLVVVMNREQVGGGGGKRRVVIKGKVMRLYGEEPYTLAELAADVNDPEIFAYDAQRREAFAMASIVVHGTLQIGDPGDRKLGETLVLDTVVCGDLRLEVARGGTLKVHHSDIRTKTMQMTVDACSLGYFFYVDGRFEAADSRFLYMSGSGSETARARAEVDLQRVRFMLCDGCAFHTVGANGAKLDIRDSKFDCQGQFGFVVEGGAGGPMVLRRCELAGQLADLALRGSGPEVDLVDCVFSREKVKFYHRSGRVRAQWTVKAKVVAEGSEQPVAGAVVAAASTGKGPAETVEATTGADGTCELLLTEYVATSSAPSLVNDLNDVTPHRIVVRSADGKVLAELPAYAAEGKGGEITLKVPAQTVAAGH